MKFITNTLSWKEWLIDYSCISLSALLTAIAVNTFFAATTLAPGGITGLSIVCSSILHFPISTMSLCISIPLLILATFLLGKSFGMKTLAITLLTPLFMNILPVFTLSSLSFSPIFRLAIAAILGGMMVGTAIGIALNHQCATGGTDVLALLIQKAIPRIPLPVLLFCLDGSIVIASGFITKNIMISIFSLLSLFMIVKTIDFVTKKGGILHAA